MTGPQTGVPPYRDTNAPFIYFDLPGAFGVLAGAIEIELAARTLIPTPDGGVSPEIVCTARLRCSPAAAAGLRDAIDKSLDLLKQLQDQGAAAAAAAAGKLN